MDAATFERQRGAVPARQPAPVDKPVRRREHLHRQTRFYAHGFDLCRHHRRGGADVHLARDPRRQPVRQDVRRLPDSTEPVWIASSGCSTVVAVASFAAFAADAASFPTSSATYTVASAGSSVCSWTALAATDSSSSTRTAEPTTVRACSELERAP